MMAFADIPSGLLEGILGIIAALMGAYLNHLYEKRKQNKAQPPSLLMQKQLEKTEKYFNPDPKLENKNPYAKEIFPVVSKIAAQQDRSFRKHRNSISYCLDEFIFPLFYDRKRLKNDAYFWAIAEAFFLSITNQENLLIANYKLYASATVTSLLNLLRKCRQSDRMAIVFIATTQSPGELSMGSSSPDTERKDNFTEVNEAYKEESKKIIQDYINENRDILLERHVFVRDFNDHDFIGDLAMLENVFTRIDRKERIKKSPDAFIDWINNNHALSLPMQRDAKKMARVQWIKSENVDKKSFFSDAICTDLIVYGFVEKKDIPRHYFTSLPPKYAELKVEWQFGLQSIDLGRVAEGRAVRLCTNQQLQSESIDFLGFKYKNLNEFINILQGESMGGNSGADNPLGLQPSKFLVDEYPWKSIIDEDKP